VPISPIHHVVLTVSDLDRSVAFYRDVLDFRVTMKGGFADREHEISLRVPPGASARVATLQPRGSVTGAVELVEFALPAEVDQPGPNRAGQIGVWVLAFEVVDEDLAAVAGRLRARGAAPVSDPVTKDVPDYGRIAWFGCPDPDGIMLEFLTLPAVDEVRARRAATRAASAAEAT
jgi:catechol 2,3-dioxygenase-like lactoylglutathione lyase family enzyme